MSRSNDASQAGRQWTKALRSSDLLEWQLFIKRQWCGVCGEARSVHCLQAMQGALSSYVPKEQLSRFNNLNWLRVWIEAVLAQT